jgi:hypothetical protein
LKNPLKGISEVTEDVLKQYFKGFFKRLCKKALLKPLFRKEHLKAEYSMIVF